MGTNLTPALLRAAEAIRNSSLTSRAIKAASSSQPVIGSALPQYLQERNEYRKIDKEALAARNAAKKKSGRSV